LLQADPLLPIGFLKGTEQDRMGLIERRVWVAFALQAADKLLHDPFPRSGIG
jgi:hypothetical protein